MNPHHSNFSDITPGGAIVRRISKGALRRRSKLRPKGGAADSPPRRPAVGTLERTRNLIMAAVRVWELKQGIRD